MSNNPSPQGVDDALAEALERDAERRLNEAEEPSDHDKYMEWMTERAERALLLADDDELDSIRIDFRKVPPRDKGEQAGKVAKPEQAQADVEVMERYTLTGEMDAADLLGMVLPPMRVICADLITEGTTLLASLPKVGKSWWCLQLAVECVLGGEFLDRQVTQGSVLYLALEDGRRRTQSRLEKVLHGREMPRGKLTIRWDAPPLGEGMEALIEEWLDAHADDAALVIVDTLGRVRTPGDGRRNAYQVDVQDVGRLQSLVRDRSVALVLVHHTKKGKEDDFVAQVSGTLGIPGSADTILVIARKRLIELATVEVTARDMSEGSIGVRFVDSQWLAAPEAMAGVSAARMAVYDAISLHGPLWPVGIARLLRSERTSVQHLVSSLLEDGLIVRTSGGYVTTQGAGMTENAIS